MSPPLPPPSPEAVALYRRRLESYQARTAAGLLVAWDDLNSYRDDDVDTFTTRVTPLLAGAKNATVATSAAFFALTLGIQAPSVSADDVDAEPRTSDPFLATWHALKMGRPVEEAIAAGRSQASAVGENFITSTARRTGDYAAKASGQRVRWRRIPGAGACTFCTTVAGQTYLSAESADFGHDRCSCSVVPA